MLIALALLVALAGAFAYVRLKPLDPVAAHLDLSDPAFVPGPRWAGFCAAPDARVTLVPADLAALNEVALATPRTAILAGSVEEGRITWVTRSALWGFADLTTAGPREVGGQAVLCLVGRQTVGMYDYGVNAARLADWITRAKGLTEAPEILWRG